MFQDEEAFRFLILFTVWVALMVLIVFNTSKNRKKVKKILLFLLIVFTLEILADIYFI